MKRKITSIVLSLCMVLSISGTAFAEEVQIESFESSLPAEVTYDTTIGEIQEDILSYIQNNNLEIEYGSEDYKNLVEEFAFMPPADMNEAIRTYYGAYASLYINRGGVDQILDKTIEDIRNENTGFDAEIQEAYTNPPEVQPVAVPYNLQAAKDYAYAYALVYNFDYPDYGSDCTNFASQILVAGGMPTTSEWNIWAGPNTIAWYNWVNVSGFLSYWSLTRGYIGPVCTTLADVNSNARSGDFLVWRNTATLEYYHTQFVQSKVNGYVYCTQHSFNYYNERLSSRFTESSFKGNHVYVVKFN